MELNLLLKKELHLHNSLYFISGCCDNVQLQINISYGKA